MAILYNKAVNTPILFDIKWDPYFNGEFWIDKENAIKYSDRIELFYQDNIVTITQNNINVLFPTMTTTLKLAGVVLLNNTFKVDQTKTFSFKYGLNTEVIEDQIVESIWIKKTKITDFESDIKIIKRWYIPQQLVGNLLCNLSTFRVEFNNDPTIIKRIIVSVTGKDQDELNALVITNITNVLEQTNNNEKLILKTSPDLDGPDFNVQIKTIIDSNFIND